MTPKGAITGSGITCLRACENANNMGMAYHPDSAYAGQAVIMTRNGYMTRAIGNITGGFWMTDKGRKFMSRWREARVTAARPPKQRSAG